MKSNIAYNKLYTFNYIEIMHHILRDVLRDFNEISNLLTYIL